MCDKATVSKLCYTPYNRILKTINHVLVRYIQNLPAPLQSTFAALSPQEATDLMSELVGLELKLSTRCYTSIMLHGKLSPAGSPAAIALEEIKGKLAEARVTVAPSTAAAGKQKKSLTSSVLMQQDGTQHDQDQEQETDDD